MLAEAVARRWLTPEGGLFSDPTYGAGLSQALHGTVDDLDQLLTRLEQQALLDERVLRVEIAGALEGETLVVRARLTDADGPFRLVLEVSAVTTQLLVEES